MSPFCKLVLDIYFILSAIGESSWTQFLALFHGRLTLPFREEYYSGHIIYGVLDKVSPAVAESHTSARKTTRILVLSGSLRPYRVGVTTLSFEFARSLVHLVKKQVHVMQGQGHFFQ